MINTINNIDIHIFKRIIRFFFEGYNNTIVHINFIKTIITYCLNQKDTNKCDIFLFLLISNLPFLVNY